MSADLEMCDDCGRYLAEMVEGIKWVSRFVNGCHGHGKAWMNRAYDLGGQALGLPFPIARKMFEDLAHGVDPKRVALELRDMIIPGRADMGEIYFAQDQRSGNWKVGFSHNADDRVAQLARINRMPLLLMATKPGIMLGEHYTHSLLMPLRIGNEWYRDGALIHEHVETAKRRLSA